MSSLPRRVDTVVVGAGQAGLTMSWYLQQAGRDHVILERGSSLGGGWQDRWDAFRLVGPNWTASFPGAPYDGEEPDGFMPRDEIAGRVARYAATIGAPVILDAGVSRLARTGAGDGFEVETAQGTLRAREVVIATGGFHRPRVPAIAAGLPARVLSLHAHDYSHPADLPAGAILVVGSGQTGAQLVEELLTAGRDVFLSVGSSGRVPRRYRGRDLFYWLWLMAERGAELGVKLPTVDELPDPSRRLAGNPHLSGHGGGHETDLRRFGLAGTTLLGRIAGIDGERISLAGDLRANLASADRFFAEKFQEACDKIIRAAGLDCPPAEESAPTEYEPQVIETLDLRAKGIGAVLWTTGYAQDFAWIDLPITDEWGFVRQRHGVSEVSGLFLLGSLWQVDQTSATLVGLPRDARLLAARMGLLRDGAESGSGEPA